MDVEIHRQREPHQRRQLDTREHLDAARWRYTYLRHLWDFY